MVVIHHQNALATQISRWLQVPRWRAPLQRQGHPKRGAATKLTDNAYLPTHQFGQALANGQAQPCAPIAARGRGISLLEALEQAPHLLWRQPDAGIAHLKAQQHLLPTLFHHAHHDGDFALFSEFDGVVGVVDENLPQPQRVPHQVGRHIAGDIANQFQPLGSRLVAHDIGHAFEQAIKHKWLVLHRELACLDF